MAQCCVSINRVDFNICDAVSRHHCTKVRQKRRDVTPDPLPKVPKFLDPMEGSAGLRGSFPHIFLYLRLVLGNPWGLRNLFYPLNTHGEIEDFLFFA